MPRRPRPSTRPPTRQAAEEAADSATWAAKTTAAERATLAYAGAVAACACGVLSKETAAAAPVVALLAAAQPGWVLRYLRLAAWPDDLTAAGGRPAGRQQPSATGPRPGSTRGSPARAIDPLRISSELVTSRDVPRRPPAASPATFRRLTGPTPAAYRRLPGEVAAVGGPSPPGGRKRVAVEHRIGKLKMWRDADEQWRNPRRSHALVMKNVAGLHNRMFVEGPGLSPVVEPAGRCKIIPISQRVYRNVVHPDVLVGEEPWAAGVEPRGGLKPGSGIRSGAPMSLAVAKQAIAGGLFGVVADLMVWTLPAYCQFFSDHVDRRNLTRQGTLIGFSPQIR